MLGSGVKGRMWGKFELVSLYMSFKNSPTSNANEITGPLLLQVALVLADACEVSR